MLSAETFQADLPVAVAALVPLVLIVSAVDANLAGRWARRYGSNTEPPSLHGWAFALPLVIALAMLASGFAALVLSLVELRLRTNRFDNFVFGLALVPVAGLLWHLVARVVRQLRGWERSAAMFCSKQDDA